VATETGPAVAVGSPSAVCAWVVVRDPETAALLTPLPEKPGPAEAEVLLELTGALCETPSVPEAVWGGDTGVA